MKKLGYMLEISYGLRPAPFSQSEKGAGSQETISREVLCVSYSGCVARIESKLSVISVSTFEGVGDVEPMILAMRSEGTWAQDLSVFSCEITAGKTGTLPV